MKSYRKGTVSLVVFEKEHNGKKFDSVIVENSYFDKTDNEWKKTTSLNSNDLNNLKSCIEKYQSDTVKFYQKDDSISEQQPSNETSGDLEDDAIPF